MNTGPWMSPSPMEIGLHPELSLVALLQQTIDITTCSLIAANPELDEPDFTPWGQQSPATILSRYLLKQLDLLAELLPEYKTAVIEQDCPSNQPVSTDSHPF